MFCLHFWRCYVFCLQYSNHKAMITWCFCSTETSDIDESVLHFLAAKYVVDLIIYCYCFRQIFGINSFVFPYSYVGSFVFKGCVADEKVVDCAEIDEMLSTIISNTTSKTSNAIVTDMCCLIFFPTLAFQSPMKNTSDLILSSLRTVNTSL